MKPYQTVPIDECGEPLLPIPPSIPRLVPHPYMSLGAPYGDRSPFCLRAGVIQRLLNARTQLQHQYPDLDLIIFDAYRPVAVQQFMVDYSLREQAKARSLDPDALTDRQHTDLMATVLQFWAIPSDDPLDPPPHSTGSAVDLTLCDRHTQQVLDLGSAIDEISERSYPDHFARSDHPDAPIFDHRRQILRTVMIQQGFAQHPHEWWHFSYGDRLWAWLQPPQQQGQKQAFYGGC